MENLIKLENGIALLDAGTAKVLADYERRMKELKALEDKVKASILEEMETKGIIKVETDDLVINYIQPTDRETFDSKTFRKEHADLYDEYVKMTPVKSSVRIKVK